LIWRINVLISDAFAQIATAGSPSSFMSFLPLILMFVVLYFIMIRPQMKRQKEHRAMLAALAKGDEVVTTGGMTGKVSKISDSFVSLEVAAQVEVNVQKSAISMLLPKGTLKSL
jgi:preprotein translocase subunit YajC